MNIILLSGGSGKRLWPLSNDIRSKQFIKLFKKADGTYESMVQRVYRQIHEIDQEANITVATSKAQVSTLHNQLGNKVNICVEPTRKDTFPAIALASAYLADKENIGKDEAVVVCPVDPFVDQDYFKGLKKLEELVKTGSANLTLMGIEPTYPSEKYGYIIPKDAGSVSQVQYFKEKPDIQTAEEYMKAGALWNGGVFAFKLDYILNKAKDLTGYSSYQELFEQYQTLNKISFDYAVAEREPNIQVMRFSGKWKDLGTWNTLTEEMSEPVTGIGVLNSSCENTAIINELNLPILCMGLKDVIVSASNEGILVSTREQSSYIKPFVDEFNQRVMFAEKSWGNFKILDVEDMSLTIKVVLNSGHSMNYHSHEYREEVWTITKGLATVIVDGMQRAVRPGDVITMPAGCKHTIIADTEVELIEVQLGNEISIKDKIKYNLEDELKRR